MLQLEQGSEYLICFELSGNVEAGGLLDNIFQNGWRCSGKICKQEADH